MYNKFTSCQIFIHNHKNDIFVTCRYVVAYEIGTKMVVSIREN